MPTLIPDVLYSTVQGRDLYLDILRPDPLPATPMPAIVELHPGAWMYGGKLPERNRLFAENGFFTVSVDYRHSGEAIFPAQIEDVRAAVRWLRANAAAQHVDPLRIGVWGESSGGHLASLLGAAGDRQTPAEQPAEAGPSAVVQAVATVSGPSDLVALDNQFVPPLLGGPIPERRELADQANPISYLTPGRPLPPFLILHGRSDGQVPLDQATLLQKALESAGAETETILYDTAHNLLASRYGDQARAALLEFFRRRLLPDD
jgi:acetyl esterase/lipase